ncbi:MAG: sodium/glutamate symporter [Ruminobacter sp.]|nr:sodium/glutamate symporter [Ruminobacter sp.]
MMQSQTVIYSLDMMNSLICATLVLIMGHAVKSILPFLRKFFIPGPVAGGIFFAIMSLIAHEYWNHELHFDNQLKDLTMMMFFTGIGYMASFRLLLRGGKEVLLFTLCTVLMIVEQNLTGIGMACLFNENPLLGLATGSISLVGGHGTSAAFGVELEKAGLAGGLSIAVTCATFGLISGSLIGGPLGKFIIKRHSIEYPGHRDFSADECEQEQTVKHLREDTLGAALIYIFSAVAVGTLLMDWLKSAGFVLPAYLGPMVVACFIRNIVDCTGHRVPDHAIATSGNLALQYFLAFALMNLHLWELKSLAGPIAVTLAVQCLFLILFVYFVTFRIMGRNYNSAVLCCGQCGFGMGATPNALANMATLTGFYGQAPRAFFVVSIVGSLIIDFVNALIITGFSKVLS